MTRGKQGGFYPHDDLLLGYSQLHMAQMVIEQKKPKLQYFNMKKKKKRRYIHQKVAVEGHKEGSRGQPVICTSQNHILQ
jgi:hypothetical protein